MSKVRQQIDLGGDPADAIAAPAEGDLAPWVVFTQLAAKGPFVYAGWLDAVDRDMAMLFAREHYGRDQACVALWAIHRDFVVGAHPGPDELVLPAPAAWQPFAPPRPDTPLVSLDGTVEATTAVEAMEKARASFPVARDAEELWVVPAAHIEATGPDDLVWRLTDQSYRLARGYSRDVREKWERVRELQAVREYEKEDLEEAF